MNPEPVNILCLKWGDRYGPHYVNILFRSVSANLRRPFRFHCCTDDPSGLDSGVEVIPFPEDPGLPGGRSWPDILVKLTIFQDGFGGLQGPTLFLDLDVAILGGLDCFFEYEPGKNCIIHNWIAPHKELLRNRPAIGNSSAFRFEAGASHSIYETFLGEMDRAVDRAQFSTEQAFMTYAMKEPCWWPEVWVRSYKRHCRPPFPLNLWLTPRAPKDCRILVFHGRPDPDEAISGYRGKKLHHHMKPAPWLAKYWNLEPA